MQEVLTKYLCIVKNYLKKMLKIPDSTSYSIRDIILREITSSLALQLNSELNSESRIHEYRKSIKRCRSLLRLLKQCINEIDYERLDNKLSEVAEEMTQRREATVNLRTFLKLTQNYQTFVPEDIKKQVIADLTQKLEKAYGMINTDPVKTESSILFHLKALWSDLNNIAIKSSTYSDFIDTIEKTHYKAARLYFDSRNTLDTEIIHKWRKYTKHLLLQMRFTPEIDRTEMEPLLSKLDRISELLGKDHDLAVLETKLKENPILHTENLQTIHLVICKERTIIQKETFKLGEEVFSESQVRNLRIKSYY